MRINHLDELIKDGLLNEALLVDAGRKVLEVDGALYRLSQIHDKFDIDIGFDEGVGDLLDHGIESLPHISHLLGIAVLSSAHLLVEIGRPREVCDCGIDAPPEILEHHSSGCVGKLLERWGCKAWGVVGDVLAVFCGECKHGGARFALPSAFWLP